MTQDVDTRSPDAREVVTGEKTLPTTMPLQGAIVEQYVKCSKTACHCAQGKRHGPYYYRIWRDGDQIHKEYVRAPELEQIRARCDQFQAMMETLRRARTQRQDAMRQIACRCREFSRLTKNR